MNSNIMCISSIYEESVYGAPIPITADFQAFHATVFECAKHLQPGNSVCFFTPFPVVRPSVGVAQAEQVAWLKEELAKLHFLFLNQRTFLWTITVRPDIHLDHEWDDYRVIAHIVRVT